MELSIGKLLLYLTMALADHTYGGDTTRPLHETQERDRMILTQAFYHLTNDPAMNDVLDDNIAVPCTFPTLRKAITTLTRWWR